MLGVELQTAGTDIETTPSKLVLVANHVSWLDIFILNALRPARFVAKSELKRWPLLGWLIAGSGTLFIERTKRRDAARVNEKIKCALAAGDIVAVFPEGTTTNGYEILRFHGSLLQPVIDIQGYVLPIALAYKNVLGEKSVAPAYFGGINFFQSFWRIIGEHKLKAELVLLPPLPAQGQHRRMLAERSREYISQALNLLDAGSVPERRVDPPI